MKISVVHPSRSRPVMARQNFDYWLSRFSGKNTIEWVLSLDSDDPDLEAYYNEFEGTGVFIMVGSNNGMVQATNAGASVITGDIIVMVSDDFRCPENWDTKLALKLTEKDYPRVVHVKDGYSDANRDIISIPIMNKEAFKKLGYIYHPDYFSVYVDNDLYQTAKLHGWLIDAPDLYFEHLHPSAGKGVMDDTYRRENSEKAYLHGAATFERRKSEGFPI